ncbi:hypothetical protein AUP68_06284 [Ilyonectria robusta]
MRGKSPYPARPSGSGAPAPGTRTWLILIGIDRYGSDIPSLGGCVNDVDAIRAYLEESQSVDVDASRTHYLTSPGTGRLPTLNNVVDALEDVTNRGNSGDFVYIHYSGHGTRTRTAFSDLKGNNMDEGLLLLGDAQSGDDRGKPDMLADVELVFLLGEMSKKGLVIGVTLDCCHSGGLDRYERHVRGVELNERQLVARESIIPTMSLQSTSSGSDRVSRGFASFSHWTLESAGFSMLTACEALEKAAEKLLPEGNNGRMQGLFTYHLLEILKAPGVDPARITFAMLQHLLAAQLREAGARQNPEVKGIGDRIFCRNEVQPVEGATTDDTNNPEKGSIVRLNVGIAHGFLERSNVVLLSRPNPPLRSQPLACGRINRLDNFESEVQLTETLPTQPIPAGSRAVLMSELLREQMLEPKGVRLTLGAGQSTAAVEEVRTEFNEHGTRITQLQDRGFFEARVNEQFNYEIRFCHGEVTSTIPCPHDPNDQHSPHDPRNLQRLFNYLTHTTVYHNILDLAEDNSRMSPLGLEIFSVGTVPGDSKLTIPRKRGDPSNPPPNFNKHPDDEDPVTVDIDMNERLMVRVRNANGNSTLHYAVFNLEPNWSVTQLYPVGPKLLSLVPGEVCEIPLRPTVTRRIGEADPPDRATIETLLFLDTTGETNLFTDIELPKLGSTSFNTRDFRLAPPEPLMWSAVRLNVLCRSRSGRE